MAKSTKIRSRNPRKSEGGRAVSEDAEQQWNKFEGRLLALEARLADLEAVLAMTAKHYEDRLSERDQAIGELKQDVRRALTSAAAAVVLINGNQADSGSLKSPLGPMSDVPPAPIDNRSMKRRR